MRQAPGQLCTCSLRRPLIRTPVGRLVSGHKIVGAESFPHCKRLRMIGHLPTAGFRRRTPPTPAALGRPPCCATAAATATMDAMDSPTRDASPQPPHLASSVCDEECAPVVADRALQHHHTQACSSIPPTLHFIHPAFSCTSLPAPSFSL
jgi:hypothetical protein